MVERNSQKITFIDLFSGIGGTRTAFEEAGCECIFSSEWDKFSQVTYEANFGEKPHGDIRKIPSSDIPDHNILVAGFPCQPFSISGVSKKNSLGIPHGFDDLIQGTLFFELKRILKDKKPDAFLLENVKNLKSHDKGNTFQIILEVLEEELEYTVYHDVIDADNYVPQHRERTYIAGFKDPIPFEFPKFLAIKYLFSWNDIPGKDNGRLIRYLKQNFGIDWVKTTKIEKIDNFNIKVSIGKNDILLKLNDKQTEANLKIDDGRTDKFVVKMKNNNLEICAINKPKFRDILEKDVLEKYTLSDHLWNYLKNYAKKHREKGNGFGFGLTDLDGHSRTLSARYYKDGSEILIPQNNKNPRRLTPRECSNLMGFTQFRPDFKIPVSDTQAYRQFGNSVVVPVVYGIAKEIVYTLNNFR